MLPSILARQYQEGLIDYMIKGSKGIIDACLHAIRCIP